jgi:hypothetical protein
MGMFGEQTCCPCEVPLWVGALIIGLMEFGAAMDLGMLGFEYSGLMAFNTMWFALLFVPSLFYNPNYRKAVWIVFSITTVINILIGLMMVIGGAMYGMDLGQELSDAMEYGYDCQGGFMAYRDAKDAVRFAKQMYADAEPEDWAAFNADAQKVIDDTNAELVKIVNESEIPIPACEGMLCDLLDMEEDQMTPVYYGMAMQGTNPEMMWGGDRRAMRFVYDYYL